MKRLNMKEAGAIVLSRRPSLSFCLVASCLLLGSALVATRPAHAQATPPAKVEAPPPAPVVPPPAPTPAVPPAEAAPAAAPPAAAPPPTTAPPAPVPPASSGSGSQNNPPPNNPPPNNPPSAATTPPAAASPPPVFQPAAPPAKVGAPPPPPPPPAPASDASSAEIRKPRKAQIGITWDLVVPIRVPVTAGTEAGMMGGTSLQGFSLELRYWLKDRLALGALVAWHTFSDKKSRTIAIEDSTQTGLVQTDINSNEILGRITHALADRPGIRTRVPKPGEKLDISKQIIPFIGAGLGATRYLERFDTGLSVQSKENWYVAIVPEIGIEIPTKLVPVIVAGRLHYFFASSGNPDQLYATFSLGAGFD